MLHIQTPPPPNWKEALLRLPPWSLVKVCNDIAICSEVKATRSDVIVYFRYVNDGLQIYGSTPAERAHLANRWFDAFVDNTFLNGSSYGIPHHQAVDLIAHYNEIYATTMPPAERQGFIEQERTAATIWSQRRNSDPRLAHIRLTIGCTPIGNDLPYDIGPIAYQYDCPVDYHAYTYWMIDYDQNGNPYPLRAANDWQDLSGRWVPRWEQWAANGRPVDMVFGEAGPFQGVLEGWRHPNVLNGNVNWLLYAMEDWAYDMTHTLAYQRGYILGTFAFFTSGRAGDTWRYYWLEQPELNLLADKTRQVWRPNAPDPNPDPPPPDPTPDPTPDPDLTIRDFEAGWVTLTDRIQQPNGFTIRCIQPGQPLPFPDHTGNRPNATGTPEAVHKICNVNIPAHECAGGTNPVILSNPTCFKIQAVEMKQATIMETVFEGQGLGHIEWPIQCHYQPPDVFNRIPPLETEDVYAVLYINDQEVDRVQFPDLDDRNYLSLVGTGRDTMRVKLIFQTSYANSRDLFMDDVSCMRVAEPPPPTTRRWNKLAVLTSQRTSMERVIDHLVPLTYPTRTEISYSADNAFARPSNVDQHTVIVYDVAGWGGRQALEDFVNTHYHYDPPTNIVYNEFPTQNLPWPVETTNLRVTSVFNDPRDYPPNYLHEGLDFGGPLGTPILSILEGVVTRNQNTTSNGQPSKYGWHIVIASPNNTYLWYCHLQEQSPLQIGQHVNQGQQIGKLGATGNAYGAHLHLTWQEYDNPNALDGYVLPKVINPLPRLERPGIQLP